MWRLFDGGPDFSIRHGLYFKSFEQWASVVKQIRLGYYPCPGCGEMAENLYIIPSRYMPFIKGAYPLKDDLTHKIYACSYCISELANRKNRYEFSECSICKSRFKRKELKSVNDILADHGFNHHIWHKALTRGFQWGNASSELLCKRCSDISINYLRYYKKEKDEQRAFKASMKNAMKRDVYNDSYYTTLVFREWKDTLNFFNDRCAYCGAEYQAKDHFFPVKNGGRFIQGNILPACIKCNSSKLDNDPGSWLEKNVVRERVKKIIIWLNLYNSPFLIANMVGQKAL